MNIIMITGHIARDPESHTTQSGVSTSTFTVAVQRRFKNAQGQHDADFLTVVAWRQTADFCNKYLSKGRKVAVTGSVQTRSYTAQDGSKRYVTEIIADHVETLDKREDKPKDEQPAQEQPDPNQFTEVDDNELPF